MDRSCIECKAGKLACRLRCYRAAMGNALLLEILWQAKDNLDEIGSVSIHPGKRLHWSFDPLEETDYCGSSNLLAYFEGASEIFNILDEHSSLWTDSMPFPVSGNVAAEMQAAISFFQLYPCTGRPSPSESCPVARIRRRLKPKGLSPAFLRRVKLAPAPPGSDDDKEPA